MSVTAVQPSAMPDEGMDSAEIQPLIPTPERLSQLLEMDINEVRRMYQSSTERGLLVDRIMEQREALSEYHNNIYRDDISELINTGGSRLEQDPEISLMELENTLREAQETLAAKRDFLIETSPEDLPEGAEEKAALLERVKESEVGAKTEEEKGLWRKAWDAVTWLPRKHPVITTLLALAAAAWGIYALWDYLGDAVIVPNPMDGAADVADTVVAPTGGDVTGIPQTDIVGPNLEAPLTDQNLLGPLDTADVPLDAVPPIEPAVPDVTPPLDTTTVTPPPAVEVPPVEPTAPLDPTANGPVISPGHDATELYDNGPI